MVPKILRTPNVKHGLPGGPKSDHSLGENHKGSLWQPGIIQNTTKHPILVDPINIVQFNPLSCLFGTPGVP